MSNSQPHLVEFGTIGESSQGFISIAEMGNSIDFDIKRVFWTYHTPESIVRGRHAHHETEMILIAVAGRVIVNTEMPDGTMEVFTLDKPNVGVYLPKKCWHTMQYSHTAVQLVLASTVYNESDYVRNYNEFKKL